MIRRFGGAAAALTAGLWLVAPLRPARAQAVTPTTMPTRAASIKAADRLASVAIIKSWVPFSTGTAALGGVAQAVLADKAAVLQLNPSLKIRINATGRDAPSGQSAALATSRNDAVRAFLLANGVASTQIVVATTPPTDSRIGASFDIAATSAPSDVATSITGLKQTSTVVRTRPGLEVFTLPKNLANDSVGILCSPPAAARFGVADASGVVSGPLLPKSLVFVARDSARVFTLQHDVSLIADPDRIDMTTQSPDPRCK